MNNVEIIFDDDNSSNNINNTDSDYKSFCYWVAKEIFIGCYKKWIEEPQVESEKVYLNKTESE